MQKPFLYFIASVLLAAVLLQGYIFFTQPPVTKTGELDELISSLLPGWIMEELPLGQTEEVRNAVERRLQFDDVISRIYSRGNVDVGIYIAYWKPGKMPVRLVGVHTPDTCWVQNGWSCEFREHSVKKTVDEQPLLDGEYGIYEINDHRQHVLFWHIVGDRINTYEQQGMHSLTAVWHDIRRFGLNQRQEQFFIRISSNRPFEEIWNDPGFAQLMKDIANLGLKSGAPEDHSGPMT